METKIYPFKRKKINIKFHDIKKPGPKLKVNISLRDLVVMLLAFSLGRASLVGDLYPFGPAFLGAAVAYLGIGESLLVSMFVFLGQLMVLSEGLFMFKFSQYVVLFTLGGFLLKNLNFKKKALVLPLLVFLVIAFFGVYFDKSFSGTPLDFVKIGLEASFAGVLSVIFFWAFPVLKGGPGRIGAGEEFLPVLFVIGTALIGFPKLFLGPLEVKGTLIRFLVLLTAFIGGPGLGAAGGAVLGVILCFGNGQALADIGVYTFAGLLAGIFREFKRIGAVVGFLMADVALAFYLQNLSTIKAFTYQSVVAAGIFLLLPGKYLEGLKEALDGFTRKFRLFLDQPREVAKERMTECRELFLDLGNSFLELATTLAPEVIPEFRIEEVVERFPKKTCSTCTFTRLCWEREFFGTYHALLEMLTILENKGQINKSDVPGFFYKRCLRINELLNELICVYLMEKEKSRWQKKLFEEEQLTKHQLKGVGEIFLELNRALDLDFLYDQKNSVKIFRRLCEENLPVVTVLAKPSGGRGLMVEIKTLKCPGNKPCQNKIPQILGEETGGEFILLQKRCGQRDGGECNLNYLPREELEGRIGIGMAVKTGEAVSGDSYRVVRYSPGKLILMLSDGMGSGELARRESSACLIMVERLLSFGLSPLKALEAVDALIRLKNRQERYLTLDLALVDLISRQVTFYKRGAVTSFLKRGAAVEKIAGENLPLGSGIDLKLKERYQLLFPGDLLVLMSDGLLDALGGEERVIKILLEEEDFSPELLAEYLLAHAKLRHQNVVFDDQTVIVARFFEKTRSEQVVHQISQYR
ncbi:stage II sporulation protein E [Carboxydothermus pertinax]|uniref:Stage II sporulation protein E n=1 Tax=Carboxydothermus pertinax TaxID=870242 RepID=A0A1L8CYJ5_9THEO|nr:stage II sporulation protein E [Carboxydothermus pertinax]GAV24002.1 stage II sporulation protein E [Carboxydothermus pertinax]